MCDDFLKARITATENSIVSLENAMLGITDAGAIIEYRLDTGQSNTKVVRQNLKTAMDVYNGLLNLRDVLLARCNGSGVINSGSSQL